MCALEAHWAGEYAVQAAFSTGPSCLAMGSTQGVASSGNAGQQHKVGLLGGCLVRTVSGGAPTVGPLFKVALFGEAGGAAFQNRLFWKGGVCGASF